MDTREALAIDRSVLLPMKLVIVGYSKPGQMGNYLASAARSLGVAHELIDLGKAEARSRIVQHCCWHFFGKRPAKASAFAAQVLDRCATVKPGVVITTGGRVPLDRRHIETLQQRGAKVVNYSTDDPWNPGLHARWFIAALPAYDVVFTPRHANMAEFRKTGVRTIHCLPFAYDPEVHRPWIEAPPPETRDVLFVGGCDADRLPLIAALADAGLSLTLFGQYWDRHAKTRAYWRGTADQETIRAASASAAICLCLVRRANRDGHVMRSFEAAAIGGCILAEDTPDHRELYGPEGKTACYFKTIADLVQQAQTLKADSGLRRHLAVNLRERMKTRKDTYADRLMAMLRLSNADGITREVSSAWA
jgi:spore maturation protein CgeB